MLETLLIALRLQVAYSTNGIQYYIRKIPLVKRLFWGKPYDNADFKQVFTVLGGIWELIKKFACKLIYIPKTAGTMHKAIMLRISQIGRTICNRGRPAANASNIIVAIIFPQFTFFICL